MFADYMTRVNNKITFPLKTSQAYTKHYETEFSSGVYTAGIDFPSGWYDITAIKGNGQVISCGWLNGYGGGTVQSENEITASLGIGDDEIYEKQYKNVNLPKGAGLKVCNVTIDLVPSK